MSSRSPFFSIIIPTYNESQDILNTLYAIRDNSFQDYEVLVVDASSDNTPYLVENFGDHRFHLLPQNNCDGRCGARNQGIRSSKGEVVVILNADVHLPSNFLSQLKTHYDTGADYVIVDSTVENKTHPFGAMVEAEHRYLYHSGREIVNWSEGYSCRRSCAIAVGLFPEKLVVPICAGEDAVFGEEIAKRYKRVVDFTLCVKHVVPEDLLTFWKQRIGRGEGCTQRFLLLEHQPQKHVFWNGVFWTFKSIAWIILLWPMFHYAQKLHRHWQSVSVFNYLWPIFLSRVGHEYGRWKSLKKIWNKVQKKDSIQISQ